MHIKWRQSNRCKFMMLHAFAIILIFYRLYWIGACFCTPSSPFVSYCLQHVVLKCALSGDDDTTIIRAMKRQVISSLIVLNRKTLVFIARYILDSIEFIYQFNNNLSFKNCISLIPFIQLWACPSEEHRRWLTPTMNELGKIKCEEKGKNTYEEQGKSVCEEKEKNATCADVFFSWNPSLFFSEAYGR